MSKMLITGGPVHAHLDDVKIITNQFRGSLMAKLAKDLADRGHDVIYLTSFIEQRRQIQDLSGSNVIVHGHGGVDDYMKKVLQVAPHMNVIVLGAAVANLIPKNRFPGKFPSHQYKPGDTIPIDFTIAPRIIDEVKKVALNVHLFGFKLLSGASRDELITAAYGVLLDSKSTAVFANDKNNLNQIYMVTKERAVHPMERDDIPDKIIELAHDQYYHTDIIGVDIHSTACIVSMRFDGDGGNYKYSVALRRFWSLVEKYRSEWVKVPEGYLFGTIAVRCGLGFLTTGRGKQELNRVVYVSHVDHMNRIVFATDKPTLNAPLLSYLFAANPRVDVIIHSHQQMDGWTTLPYAPPGTVRDSEREMHESFNIERHGYFRLLTGDEIHV